MKNAMYRRMQIFSENEVKYLEISGYVWTEPKNFNMVFHFEVLKLCCFL